MGTVASGTQAFRRRSFKKENGNSGSSTVEWRPALSSTSASFTFVCFGVNWMTRLLWIFMSSKSYGPTTFWLSNHIPPSAMSRLPGPFHMEMRQHHRLYKRNGRSQRWRHPLVCIERKWSPFFPCMLSAIASERVPEIRKPDCYWLQPQRGRDSVYSMLGKSRALWEKKEEWVGLTPKQRVTLASNSSQGSHAPPTAYITLSSILK